MEKDKLDYIQKINNAGIERLKTELMALDGEMVDAGGVQLKPSQCYRFETDPLHVIFNTNCPDTLREKIGVIIARHVNHQ